MVWETEPWRRMAGNRRHGDMYGWSLNVVARIEGRWSRWNQWNGIHDVVIADAAVAVGLSFRKLALHIFGASVKIQLGHVHLF
jgi:hypothetical protein